jgi:hypothetical protein
MLALMAGRNAGAGINIVNEGKVSSILPTTPFLPRLPTMMMKS